MSLKKKVRFGVQPAGRPNSEINVTPLVDVVLVLLIIFMVVTPLLEKDIGIATTLAEELGVEAPIGRAVESWWTQLAAELDPDADHTEIIRPMEDRNGVRVRTAETVAEPAG